MNYEEKFSREQAFAREDLIKSEGELAARSFAVGVCHRGNVAKYPAIASKGEHKALGE